MKQITKQQVLNNLEQIKQYIADIENENNEWVTIDNTKIPQEYFDKWGVKPFQIMKRKMRDENGAVWNNINYFDARKEAQKLGYRLPHVQEQMMLLDYYSTTKENPSIEDTEFLGIEELSYDEKVYLEWVVLNDRVAFLRGGLWGACTSTGVETLYLSTIPSVTSSSIGFRCARDMS